MRSWSSEKWNDVRSGWKLVPLPGPEPSPPVSFQCQAQPVWKILRLFVGNVRHPGEQHELTSLPYAGNCLLRAVFGSFCSCWGSPVCGSVLWALGGMMPPLPMLSTSSEKRYVKVSRWRRIRFWEAPVYKSRVVKAVQPLPHQKIIKIFACPFLFWNLCNCMH